MSKLKDFEKDLRRMEREDMIVDTRNNHIYRLRVNREGLFAVTQNRFNRITGVVTDYVINEWEFAILDFAIIKMNEIKSKPNMTTIPYNTKLRFSR